MGSCTLCPLHADALTVCVRPRGATQAKILIVGQNPGREEDMAGEAFVGKSGKLLDGMLADAGFAPDEYRLTNTVRCVTPKNRAPLPSEIAACNVHLRAEITAMCPDVIIAMGDVALKALIANTMLANARGKAFPLRPEYGHACEVFVTFHPAYVLRVPMARNTVVVDLRRVRDRFRVHEEIPWEYWEHAAGRSIGRLLSYDIETFDEEGNITDRPTQVAVHDGTLTFVSRPEQTDDAIARLRLLEDTVIVGHNVWQFDDHKTGIDSDYDTMVMAHLDDETQPLNLEALCVKYLGVKGWKEERDAALGSRELALYNARDAVYTRRLFVVLHERLGKRIHLLEDIIRPMRWLLDDAQKRGVYLDAQAIEEARIKHEPIVEARRQDVIRIAYEQGFPRDFFDKQLKTKIKHIEFNPGSRQQVGKVLDFFGFNLPLTDTGELRTDKETLSYIDHPMVDALAEFFEERTKMSNFVIPYLKLATANDHRSHTQYKLTSTDTGRSSSSNPRDGLWAGWGRNDQQLHREFKHFHSAPPGKILTSADWSGIEFRMGAFIADEHVIIENYAREPKWDPHSWFACRLYGKSPEEVAADVLAKKAAGSTDSMRQIAKSGNFSQEYLGTGDTLRRYAAREMGIHLSRAESDRVHRAWHASFPGWVPFYGRTKEELLEHGYVESLTGRRRNFGDLSLLNRQQLLEALRQAVNFKVQSFCFDIAGLAGRALLHAGLPVVLFVHDDFKFEFDSMEQALAAEPIIRRCMIDEPLRKLQEIWGIVPSVPLEIEIVHKPGKQAIEQLPSVLELV